MNRNSLLRYFMKGAEGCSDIELEDVGTLVFEVGQLVHRPTASCGDDFIATFEQRKGQFLSEARSAISSVFGFSICNGKRTKFQLPAILGVETFLEVRMTELYDYMRWSILLKYRIAFLLVECYWSNGRSGLM